MKYKLSNQAIGSMMLAVNRGLTNAALGLPKEECDIVSILQGFEIENTADGLMVLNPPTLAYSDEMFKDDDDQESKE